MQHGGISRRSVVAGLGWGAVAVGTGCVTTDGPGGGERIAVPTGVVILHGKEGNPAAFDSNIRPLANALQSIGCRVAQPEMPWARQRYMRATYEAGQAEISGVIDDLRKNGAVRIIVSGISLGANAALAYAARSGGVDGLMLFSLGLWPEHMVNRAEYAQAALEARRMIAAGRGNEGGSWPDRNVDRVFRASTSASIWYSYHNPVGTAAVEPNFARLPDDLPLFVAAARSDQPDAGRTEALFNRRGQQPPISQFLMLSDANHFNTPERTRTQAADWVKHLAETWRTAPRPGAPAV